MAAKRYTEVARDLTEGISTGRFPVGSTLPTEHELCDLYGVSRHTIRAAIKELQELGLVSRRKRFGTRVEAASAKTGSYRPSLSSIEDVIQFGEAYTRVVQRIEDVEADKSLARTLGCSPGRKWLCVSSLRFRGPSDGDPIGWTDTYVDEAYASLREVVTDTPNVLISSLIENRFGRRIAEIRQEITGVCIPEELAHALRVAEGTAGLRITRRYVDGAGACFEVSVSTHPAERFTVAMLLRRDHS